MKRFWVAQPVGRVRLAEGEKRPVGGWPRVGSGFWEEMMAVWSMALTVPASDNPQPTTHNFQELAP